MTYLETALFRLTGFKIKIIDRYILKELSSSFFFGLFAFLTIFLVDILMELIDYIISKGVSAEVVFRLFLYALPAVLVLVIPMALLFSVLISLGRLSSDGEITAMKSGGIHFLRILAPIIAIGFVLSGLTFFLNEVLVPRANQLRREVFKKVILQRPLPKIAENVFFEGGKDQTFYVRKYDSEKAIMHHVTIFETRHRKYPNIIDARSGVWEKKEGEPDGRWVLEDGYLREFSTEAEELHTGRFRRMYMPAELSGETASESKYLMPREMNMRELYARIKELEKARVDATNLRVELHFKTSLPFASIVFVLIGAPLAITPRRSGKSIGMGLSIVIIFGYYVIMSAGRALAEGNVIPPVLGAWAQNIIIGIAGGVLIYFARR